MAKTAEIIAIGDELVSGQRLDTNSQWLSMSLAEIGIEPSFHTTVGDSFEDGMQVFSNATKRADIVISTGGIGPTKDDLTRQVIADVGKVDLIFDAATEDHIREIFASYGREMPGNNSIQAYFPAGSRIIPNAEGTAPGIDFETNGARIFALPGVPYEMKQMWSEYLVPNLIDGPQKRIKHHVIHCFGAGESQIELMLNGLTDRGRDPRVGITASKATISLRITTQGESEDECQRKIDPIANFVRERLGNLVFGENGIELPQVNIDLLKQLGLTIGVADFCFGGRVAQALFAADTQQVAYRGGKFESGSEWSRFENGISVAKQTRDFFSTEIGFAISPLVEGETHSQFDIAIVSDDSSLTKTLRYSGHSGLREERTDKLILNELRLFLQNKI
ncbi:MAG: molybdopterin-binding protein [Planctomycetota bacterium]